MKFFALALVTLMAACSVEHQNSSHLKDVSENWTTLGAETKGMKVFDIRAIDVLQDDKKIKLNAVVNQSKKRKAVIQVVEIFESGGVCRGCLNKANRVYNAVKRNKQLAAETTFIVVLSGDQTPSTRTASYARKYLDTNITLVRDIEGSFQKKFSTGRSPVTLVLESKYRGTVLDLHRQQISEVVDTLAVLPKK